MFLFSILIYIWTKHHNDQSEAQYVLCIHNAGSKYTNNNRLAREENPWHKRNRPQAGFAKATVQLSIVAFYAMPGLNFFPLTLLMLQASLSQTKNILTFVSSRQWVHAPAFRFDFLTLGFDRERAGINHLPRLKCKTVGLTLSLGTTLS